MSVDDHANAMKMLESYGCPDPFVIFEMEEFGVGTILKRLNMPDRFIIIRDNVNMDVFMAGQTPESLWNPDYHEPLASENNFEAADIFATARGKKICRRQRYHSGCFRRGIVTKM